MTKEYRSVLGLFPFFGLGATGGIQTSARIAWPAVARYLEGEAKTTLLSYGRGNPNGSSEPASESINVNSKTQAVFTALSRSWRQELVLVWHVGFLKLLPFLRLSHPRIVVALHGIEAWEESGWLTRKQLDGVDLFLTFSTYTWERFLTLNPRYRNRPHRTIAHGVGVPLGGAVPAIDDLPIALMISRLSQTEDYKGHREVIDAWPSVLQRLPGAQLWIAGDGCLRPGLERLVREMGLKDAIRFWGLVSDVEKQQLLARCHCLAMPSRGEGFGLVYLEAMRLGRPCLTSTMDAGREVVNPPEAGLAVDPDNRDQIVDALCRLLSPGEEWREWSSRARYRYESIFTMRHFEQRLLTSLFDQRDKDPCPENAGVLLASI
jgi:phosphatidyl-myo-inositol dimannoside synthase